MEKLYSLTVRGKNRTWAFPVMIDEEHLKDWLEDGLKIEKIYNTIPIWIVNLGMTKIWCLLQNIYNFENPFKK